MITETKQKKMEKKELLELLKKKDDEIEYLKGKIDVLNSRIRWRDQEIGFLIH